MTKTRQYHLTPPFEFPKTVDGSPIDFTVYSLCNPETLTWQPSLGDSLDEERRKPLLKVTDSTAAAALLELMRKGHLTLAKTLGGSNWRLSFTSSTEDNLNPFEWRALKALKKSGNTRNLSIPIAVESIRQYFKDNMNVSSEEERRIFSSMGIDVQVYFAKRSDAWHNSTNLIAGGIGVGAGILSILTANPIPFLIYGGVMGGKMLYGSKSMKKDMSELRDELEKQEDYLNGIIQFSDYIRYSPIDARYFLEKRDHDAELLSHCIALGVCSKWFSQFAPDEIMESQSIALGTNVYPAGVIARLFSAYDSSEEHSGDTIADIYGRVKSNSRKSSSNLEMIDF